VKFNRSQTGLKLEWNGPQGHLATCAYALHGSCGYCDCGWAVFCEQNWQAYGIAPDPLLAELEKLVEKWRKQARNISEMIPVSQEVQTMGHEAEVHADEVEQLLRQRRGGK
jgi:hypothetical protein